MSKASEPLKEQRVQEALDLLLIYTPTETIVKIFNAKYNLKKNATYRYISLAKRQWKLHNVDKLEEKRVKAIRVLEKLYAMAIAKQQLQTALNVLKEIHILNKLSQDVLDETNTKTTIRLIKNSSQLGSK